LGKKYTYRTDHKYPVSILQALKNAVKYSQYQCDFLETEIKKYPRKKVKILDFGAGIGTYAGMVQDLGYTVDCVEIDPDMTKQLKKKHRVYSDIKNVKEKYDVIYSLNVLEHIEDDAKALAELKNCLNTKGEIVLFVPAFNIIYNKLDEKSGHYRRYRKKDLQTLAKKADLKLIKVRYSEPIGFLLALIYRIIGGSDNLNPKSVAIYDKYLFPFSVFLEPPTKQLFGKNILGIFVK
jgi:SAM-dependent methyltransferase